MKVTLRKFGLQGNSPIEIGIWWFMDVLDKFDDLFVFQKAFEDRRWILLIYIFLNQFLELTLIVDLSYLFSLLISKSEWRYRIYSCVRSNIIFHELPSSLITFIPIILVGSLVALGNLENSCSLYWCHLHFHFSFIRLFQVPYWHLFLADLVSIFLLHWEYADRLEQK